MSALSATESVTYKKSDMKVLGSIGTTQTAFPTPSAGHGKPCKIFVQNYSQSPARLYIGKTGVAADGSTGAYELTAGSNMTLPTTEYETLYVIANTGSTSKLFVTFLSDPQ